MFPIYTYWKFASQKTTIDPEIIIIFCKELYKFLALFSANFWTPYPDYDMFDLSSSEMPHLSVVVVLWHIFLQKVFFSRRGFSSALSTQKYSHKNVYSLTLGRDTLTSWAISRFFLPNMNGNPGMKPPRPPLIRSP